MRRLFIASIAAVTISLFVLHGQTRPNAPAARRIVVHNYYYALPGKEEEVYLWRLHASDVRVKLGFPRGRVLRRIPSGIPAVADDLPDVVWECEYASAEAREKDAKAVTATPEFQEVQKHMGTLTRAFRRGTYEIADHR